MSTKDKPKAVSYGGVSPRPRKGALRGATPTAGPSGPGRFPGFTYHGGPVISAPEVHSTFWGSLWSHADHQARATRLNQFLTDLATSTFMNVLSQYGVGLGQFVGSTFVANVPDVLHDTDIHGIIQSKIDDGTFPEPGDPSNLALIIYLDENMGVEDPDITMCEPTSDNAFGYHNFFITSAGNPFYYAVIPSVDDTCVHNTCPDDASCSLHRAQTQEQRQTQVTSHEFAEMTTDPQLNAWFDPDPNNGENGDICNGESATITVGANAWTVQRTYSKADDMATNGESFCLSEAPNPLEPLHPGPV